MSTRVAVVTGGNKGIGLAIVRALCKQFEGDVYLTARDVGRGEVAVESLGTEGLKPLFQQLDINDINSITTAAAFFKEKYGGVDVLINNAGIAFKVADTAPFAVQAEVTLKTNFFATRDMLTHFMPLIKAGGRVVNVSSFVGCRTLNQCSPALRQRFRSDDITEDELVGLMQRFVDEAKKGTHKEDGWADTAYGVSKTGLTTLSYILARRLSKERPNDGLQCFLIGNTGSSTSGAASLVCGVVAVGVVLVGMSGRALHRSPMAVVGALACPDLGGSCGDDPCGHWWGGSRCGWIPKILLNACCPGWVRTDMAGTKAPKSPDEGAETPVYLALLPPGATEPHGKFVSEKEVQPW